MHLFKTCSPILNQDVKITMIFPPQILGTRPSAKLHEPIPMPAHALPQTLSSHEHHDVVQVGMLLASQPTSNTIKAVEPADHVPPPDGESTPARSEQAEASFFREEALHRDEQQAHDEHQVRLENFHKAEVGAAEEGQQQVAAA